MSLSTIREFPPPSVIRSCTETQRWKKVTTNVSNFIMGSPIIDHYGDLIVTNHRTGETCTLTFKPRGWRGANAFEIKGTVADQSGHAAWDIAGRRSYILPFLSSPTDLPGWDTQLIARRAGSSAPLEVDTQVGGSQKEYLLLWRNSEKPKEPFNLTPYAITLVSPDYRFESGLTIRMTYRAVLNDIWPLPIADCVPISELSRMQNTTELKRESATLSEYTLLI
jgi:hypothetical protein